MAHFNYRKYPAFAFAPQIKNRSWPNKSILEAPEWCSVDLRDGNQALIDPMSISQKIRFWKTLVNIGFTQIETGFPSASQTEYDFHRKLIEENYIPEDVVIQVLVQAREHLIERTFESLKGVKKAIVHVYNSTSRVQRKKAFEKSKEEIKTIAVNGAKLLKKHAANNPNTEWIFQYSPESFSQTEPDFAIEIVEAVCRIWEPEKGQKVIINLPATVEASTPNIFADQVEFFCKNLPSRKHVTISLHTHNDRGCAIAAAELGILAGADRIEGTLFGNGERTGNMDIVAMAMNLYSQGIDPQLNFSDMNEIVQTVTDCNNLPIHPRHPWVGELVFTAFSGSHQDAIKKCLEKSNDDNNHWDVAYLPIDPQDIGRTYQDIVRINSQSGKGGVAYVLQRDYGVELPRWMQIDFSPIVQKQSETKEQELTTEEIWELFQQNYMKKNPNSLKSFHFSRNRDNETLEGSLLNDTHKFEIKGEGNGTITAFIDAMENYTSKKLRVLNYTEHALSSGTRAQAMAYVQIEVDSCVYAGVGISLDTVEAMLNAVLSAINRHTQ